MNNESRAAPAPPETVTSYMNEVAAKLAASGQPLGYVRMLIERADGIEMLYDCARACNLKALVSGVVGTEYPQSVYVILMRVETARKLFPASLDGSISVDAFMTEVNGAIANMPEQTFFSLAVDSPTAAAAEQFVDAARKALGQRFASSRIPTPTQAGQFAHWTFAVAGPGAFAQAGKSATKRALAHR